MLRLVLAPNASAMTLDGTRTYLVGNDQVAIIDPGSTDPAHLDAVSDLIGDGVVASILVTHSHADHDDGADELGRRFHAPVLRFADGSLTHDQRVETDVGVLRALHTPGHSPDHVSFHWPLESAIFCGDLMMGGLDTAWVGAPEGNLGAWLRSIELLGSLSPTAIYPAHGPPFHEPMEALVRYRDHRLDRELQVLDGLIDGPASAEQITRRVYGGTVAPELLPYARRSTEVYLAHLEERGMVAKSLSDLWIRL